MTMNTQRRALLAAGLGAPVLLPMAARAQGIPKAWDRTVDILVVGTGFAGLCAAIEAKRAGANPLLIDMMPFTGGNSRITGGGIAVPGSARLEAWKMPRVVRWVLTYYYMGIDKYKK